jgi:hypothetical protein
MEQGRTQIRWCFGQAKSEGTFQLTICHGMSGRPNSRNMAFVTSVYLSSESIKRPSMSNKHARTGGKLSYVSYCTFLRTVI